MPKLTIEFNERMNEMLAVLAAKDGTTKVDIIRRALVLYNFVEADLDDSGKRRLAITEDNKVLKEIILR